MSRIRAHTARLVGLSDGIRDGAQNILLYLVPRRGGEACPIALTLEDARRLHIGLTAMLPEVLESQQDLTEAN